MKAALLKAQAKKNKFLNNISELKKKEDDSDASLTSDDEEEVSKGYVNQIFNDRYICLKYLGRGTFSRVWLVLDIKENQYFAMKTVFSEFYEDSLHEIKVNKIVNSNTEDSYVVRMIDNFVFNNDGKSEMCIIVELLGTTLHDLLGENNLTDSDFEDIDDDDENQSQNSDISDDFIYTQPSVRLFKRIMIDIFKGLNEIHSKNIVHTDLKFENIMIDILDPKIVDIIEKFRELKLYDQYKELISQCLPENYNVLDKVKKKKIKRKAKVKALKLLRNIVEKNNSFINHDNNIDNDNTQNDRTLSLQDLENMDMNKFRFKIIDLGNAEFLDNKVQDEIMIRNYRPPENIIGEYFDCKADIWSIGCIAYELLTNRYLFKVSRKKKSIDRDRAHLHEMYEIFGKMPRDMTQNCDFSEQLFDSKGRILKNKNCEYTDLEKLLQDESEYNESEIKDLSIFLKKLMDYNLKTRYSANDALEDQWLLN